MRIFISYARADGREYAAKLESALQTAGFKTWRDTRSQPKRASPFYF